MLPRIPGVRWHVSRRFTERDIVPGFGLPMVSRGRAVIDAAAWTPKPRIACALMAASVQQRVVPWLRSGRELAVAGAIRHGWVLRAILADIEAVANSLSEIDFVKLARKGGLASADRQSIRYDSAGRRRYLDVDFGTFAVEVDGGLHLHAPNYWADALRQNELVLGGDRILRVFQLRDPSGRGRRDCSTSTSSPGIRLNLVARPRLLERVHATNSLHAAVSVPGGELASTADGAQAAFGFDPRGRGRHDQQRVAAAQLSLVRRHKAHAIADDEGDRRATREPQLEDLDSVQQRARWNAQLQHLRIEVFQRCCFDVDVCRFGSDHEPRKRATRGMSVPARG